MLGVIQGISVLFLAVLGYYVSKLVSNFAHARKAGLPYIVIPFDQNALMWMILSVPLRPFFKRHLPNWITERLLITIYGHEFHVGREPFDKWANGEKTVALVTCGKFEVNSWDAEFITDVLKRPKDFQEPHFNTLFVGQFGPNILTTNGEHWARQRKVVAQVVNERISKVVFDETLTQVTGLLDEVLDHGRKTSATTLRAFEMMKKITIHVLSAAGMGQSALWSDDEEPQAGHEMTYMLAAKTLMDGMAGPILLPMWFLHGVPTWFPGYTFLKNLGTAKIEFPAHTKAILEKERLRMMEPGEEAKSNAISQMVLASQGMKAGASLSEDEMVGNMFIFTAAGFDTTANTLSYTLAVLAREPQWQTWIFEEIDAILPTDDSEKLDYSAIYPKAVRIMALMYEVLRLFSPLVHIPKAPHGQQIVRTSKRDYVLPHDCTIYLNSCALHTDRDIWRDLNITDEEKAHSTMPDELAFRPTRWIDQKTGAHHQPARGTYVPWSMGPRNCPGQKMAQVEFTAALLGLFRHHRIDAEPLEVPAVGEGLGTRRETVEEVSARINERIKDSISILTLQMNGVYEVDKHGNVPNSIELRFSRRH